MNNYQSYLQISFMVFIMKCHTRKQSLHQKYWILFFFGFKWPLYGWCKWSRWQVVDFWLPSFLFNKIFFTHLTMVNYLTSWLNLMLVFGQILKILSLVPTYIIINGWRATCTILKRLCFYFSGTDLLKYVF